MVATHEQRETVPAPSSPGDLNVRLAAERPERLGFRRERFGKQMRVAQYVSGLHECSQGRKPPE